MTRSNAWKIELTVAAVFLAEYFAVRSVTNQNLVYSLFGLVAFVMILVGVWLHRPEDRSSWYLLACAVACLTLGDDVTTYYQVVQHNIPFPSIADALYLSGYPFFFAAVIRLTRGPRSHSWREDNADAFIVALGLSALAWLFLMQPYVHDNTVSTFGKVVNVAYPMMDIALVFLVVRTLVFGSIRVAFQRLLAAALTATLIADFAFDILTLHNAYTPGNIVNAAYLVQYALFGATALHPSMSQRQTATRAPTGERFSKMPYVVLCGLIPPATLLVAELVHARVDVVVMTLISVSVFLVVCLRLFWLIAGVNRQSRRLAETVQQFELLEDRFRMAFEDNMAPMVFTDLEDKIIAVNDAFCQMIGYSNEEMIGKSSQFFTHPEDVGITEDLFDRILRGEVDQGRYVKRYLRKDGRVIFVEIFRSLARDAEGRPLYNIISERDVTEERLLNEQLTDQALHDSLTGLANRALFEDRLRHAHSRATREGGLCCVLLLDLDDFKEVNDSLGHVAGDQLLVEVAQRLQRVTRETDTLCRFGGDEFLYLAEGLGSSDDAHHAAQRLLDAIAEPFEISGSRIEQGASIGVVVTDSPFINETEIIQDADVALYEAKREGKGHYAVFTPDMRQQVDSRFSLVQELRQAIKSGELVMHFQPIIDLAANRIVGFEALMRWWHPSRGWVPPTVFIPLAEQSDLILDLGHLALDESLRAARHWPRGEDSPAPFVSVNLSARQFHDIALAETIGELLATHDVACDRLVIEITEGVALRNFAETLTMMEILSARGIRFALDDFGTGYSSLSYLAMLRPNTIKVDKSFVSPSGEGGRGDALLEAILTLGHNLGMTMLAEGVETVGQRDRLRESGCELGQGFLWSPAIPANEIESLLARDLTVRGEAVAGAG